MFPEIETTIAPETLAGGEVIVSSVFFTFSGLSTFCSYLTYKLQMFLCAKPLPLIVEIVPPVNGPNPGSTELITGSG